MTTITCKIPARLNAELEAAARHQRVAKSAIVRHAIERQLNRTRAAAAPTAFDVAKAFCGALLGPEDLATNPRHLEGFGG
jgi:hypothetical protein